MLISLEMENFKGIGGRVELRLAPVTLLFGPNSVGKSTALQALQYVHHLLRRGNPSADRLPHGGDSVDLGGFRNFVHKHDIDRIVRVRVGFEVNRSVNVFDQDTDQFGFADLDDQLRVGWVELAVKSEVARDGVDAAIGEMTLGVNSEQMPLARTTRELEAEGESLFAWINTTHPLMVESASDPSAVDLFDYGGQKIQEPSGTVWWKGRIRTRKLSALPMLERPIGLLDDQAEDAIDATRLSELETLLTMLLVGLPSLLLEELDTITYVGPMRIVPGRGFVPERSPRAGRWADGSGAWDALAFGGSRMLARVNAALEKVGVPYHVAQQRLSGIVVSEKSTADDALGTEGGLGMRSAALVDAQGISFLPTDVGVGVAQIIPIIAACVRPARGLVAIEQPELHIHPGWQVQLGDLLINAAQTRQLLVETHSEHLVLRLLRRIRETTEKELHQDASVFTEDKLSVLYIEATFEGVRVRQLRVSDHGEFVDRWPKGFFAERMEELL